MGCDLLFILFVEYALMCQIMAVVNGHDQLDCGHVWSIAVLSPNENLTPCRSFRVLAILHDLKMMILNGHCLVRSRWTV